MKNTKIISKFIPAATGLAIAATFAVSALPVFAETYGSVNVKLNDDKAEARVNLDNRPQGMMNRGEGNGYMMEGQGGMMKPVVFGTVASVSGNAIVVTGSQYFGTSTAAVSFSVDATNAKIIKNGATSSVSSILVGDSVAIQGTLSGTSVIATIIHDGAMRGPQNWADKDKKDKTGTSTFIVEGNGQPVIAGSVSAVGTSTFTITNKSNVQYTVDVTNAKIVSGKDTVSFSTVKVGDTVVVQGVINGSSINASTVIEQKLSASGQVSGQKTGQGFFGGIGRFFMRLFGF